MAKVSGTPREIAVALREAVRGKVGLAITVGIAPTKFLAKVASAVAKPDGLLEVLPGGELDFLHPLPVERLWGVGKVTSAKLRDRGIRTVRDVAELDEAALIAMLGPAGGRHLNALAHARDPRPVRVGVRRRSIGSQRALGRRRMTMVDLDTALVGLIDRVTRRLRKADRLCRTVVLRLRFDDFTRATRSHTLPKPSDDTTAILATARGLLGLAEPLIRSGGCTLIGISLANLGNADDPFQPELPFSLRELTKLDRAMDGVRERFGTDSITRGVLLGRDQGLTVPMLPD